MPLVPPRSLVCFLFAFAITHACCAADSANAPAHPAGTPPTAVPKIPPEHPRLYLRARHLPDIAQRLHDPRLQTVVARLQALAAQSEQFRLEWAALNFLVEPDEAKGRATIRDTLALMRRTELPAKRDGCRITGRMMVTGAIVYDWLYPLLTADDKKEFIVEQVRLAKTMESGYPPVEQSSITGHSSEAILWRDMLSAGIAIYDEFPEMYDLTARRLMAEHVPARNWFYGGHAYHQGDSYGPYRYSWEMFGLYIFDRLGAGNIFNPEQRQVPYHWVYTTRPDGQRLRSGDPSLEKYPRENRWTEHAATLLAASYYGDGVLMDQFGRQGGTADNEAIFEFLWRDPALQPQPVASLALSRYFGLPYGWMVARTSWGEDAVIAEMKVNEYNFVNHQHLDAGAFQIYYRGPLAIDSGVYQAGSSGGYGKPHTRSYSWRTIAHNSLLIYDPNEKPGGRPEDSNDGGQRLPNRRMEARSLPVLLAPENGYRTGRVLAHDFGPDKQAPDFTLLKGDITEAYSAKVQQVVRSFVFLNLRNANVPAALVTLDRIVSADPGFKKYWLLHAMEEPRVDGASATVDRTEHGGFGRLNLDVLLPEAANAELEAVGGPGKEFWVFGKNYASDLTPEKKEKLAVERGEWRLQLSPKRAAAEDLFLNVMQVTDRRSPARFPVQRLDLSAHVGCAIAGTDATWVVLLRKDALTSDDSVEFVIPGDRPGRAIVGDLVPGTWRASHALSRTTKRMEVAADSGVAWIEGPAGAWTLTLERR